MTQTLELRLCLHLHEFALCYCHLNELFVFRDSVVGVHFFSIQIEVYVMFWSLYLLSSATMLSCDVPMLGLLFINHTDLPTGSQGVCSCCYSKTQNKSLLILVVLYCYAWQFFLTNVMPDMTWHAFSKLLHPKSDVNVAKWTHKIYWTNYLYF